VFGTNYLATNYKKGKDWIDNMLIMMMIMSLEWDYLSELRSPKGSLFITLVTCEHGETWWNDIDREK
jgi:hypothetical protein